MLTPSLPLGQSLDLPVCLARFPSARLWLKDESLQDSANLLGLNQSRAPGFPRHTQSLGASRRKGRRGDRWIPTSLRRRLIRICPLAHLSGCPSTSAAPAISVVEDLEQHFSNLLQSLLVFSGNRSSTNRGCQEMAKVATRRRAGGVVCPARDRRSCGSRSRADRARLFLRPEELQQPSASSWGSSANRRPG